ncbi:MAG: TonB-dependent receptor domain-containing protein, partial [Gemmatimonadales bacterium]
MRHKRRSVLETQGDDQPEEADPGPATAALLEGAGSWPPELAGKVELMASGAPFGAEGAAPRIDGIPASFGIVRLNGRLSDTGRWSVGGLVSESEKTVWRMAAELVFAPGSANQLQVGTAYGSGHLLPPSGTDSAGGRTEGSGAIFVQDRGQVSPRLVAIVGARYSYVGFLEDRNHIDPQATVESRHHRMVFRGTMAARTLVPGGDLLALSAASSAPAMSFARLEAGLRPERLRHYEVAVDRALGATTVGARAFHEEVGNQLVNVFEDPHVARSLRILNGGSTSTRGMGVTFSGHLGEVMNGSVTYTYGRSWRDDPAAAEAIFGAASALSYREAEFHDVMARVETFFDGTDTRLVAFYRLSTLDPDGEGPGGHSAVANSKKMCFDIQLSQGLPFMQSVTRADWELLLAVRNLFYETTEGGVLDEVTVVHP